MRFRHIVATGVLFLAASCLLTRGAFAADPVTGGVEIGIDINKVHLSGSDAKGVTTRFKRGLIVGGYVSLPISGIFEFQPELVYAQKHSGVDDHSGFKATLSDDVIEFPLLA